MRQLKILKGLDTDSRKSSVRRRGPRTQLSDAQLHNRRDELLQAFESYWAEIGWELSRCKKPDEIIDIFAPLLRMHAADIISVFCRPSTEKADSGVLRKVRSALYSLAKPTYSADESKRSAQEQLQQANFVLGDKLGSKRRVFKHERKKRRKQASRAEEGYRSVYAVRRILETRLAALEASFARQELFRFLKTERYELTPVSLANAVAYLPYSGWRQSMRRCKKQSSLVGNGVTYQVFKAICYLASRASDRSEKSLVKDFWAEIRVLPSRYRIAQTKLAEEWFYLKDAIRQSYRANPIRSAMPFKITCQYLKRVQSRTQSDLVLVEHYKIELPKRPVVAHRRNPRDNSGQ